MGRAARIPARLSYALVLVWVLGLIPPSVDCTDTPNGTTTPSTITGSNRAGVSSSSTATTTVTTTSTTTSRSGPDGPTNYSLVGGTTTDSSGNIRTTTRRSGRRTGTAASSGTINTSPITTRNSATIINSAGGRSVESLTAELDALDREKTSIIGQIKCVAADLEILVNRRGKTARAIIKKKEKKEERKERKEKESPREGSGPGAVRQLWDEIDRINKRVAELKATLTLLRADYFSKSCQEATLRGELSVALLKVDMARKEKELEEMISDLTLEDSTTTSSSSGGGGGGGSDEGEEEWVERGPRGAPDRVVFERESEGPEEARQQLRGASKSEGQVQLLGEGQVEVVGEGGVQVVDEGGAVGGQDQLEGAVGGSDYGAGGGYDYGYEGGEFDYEGYGGEFDYEGYGGEFDYEGYGGEYDYGGAAGGQQPQGAVGGYQGDRQQPRGAMGRQQLQGAVGGQELEGAVGGQELEGAVGGQDLEGAIGGYDVLDDFFAGEDILDEEVEEQVLRETFAAGPEDGEDEEWVAGDIEHYRSLRQFLFKVSRSQDTTGGSSSSAGDEGGKRSVESRAGTCTPVGPHGREDLIQRLHQMVNELGKVSKRIRRLTGEYRARQIHHRLVKNGLNKFYIPKSRRRYFMRVLGYLNRTMDGVKVTLTLLHRERVELGKGADKLRDMISSRR